jgi:hypothetical protein
MDWVWESQFIILALAIARFNFATAFLGRTIRASNAFMALMRSQGVEADVLHSTLSKSPI